MAHPSSALLLARFLNFIEFVDAKRTAPRDALVADDSPFSQFQKARDIPRRLRLGLCLYDKTRHDNPNCPQRWGGAGPIWS